MDVKNVLIFPDSNEIALEYLRALKHTKNVRLWGASTDGAGAVAFENHFVVQARSAEKEKIAIEIGALVREHGIDLVIPTNDDALYSLSMIDGLPCPGIKSSIQISRFKSKTYAALAGVVKVPCIKVDAPCFIKPDCGSGSKGAFLALHQHQLPVGEEALGLLSLEYIEGSEYTVDCFSNRSGEVLYIQPRKRLSVSNGIATDSVPVRPDKFIDLAESIQKAMPMRGAWFFQCIETALGERVVLEVGARISCNSGFSRPNGVNLPLLTIFDAFDEDVQIRPTSVVSRYFRSLRGHYLLNLPYEKLFVDLDDTLIVHGRINTDMVALICQCRNEGKEVLLLTKHASDPVKTLERFGLSGLFHKIIWIEDRSQSKWPHITPYSLFIEDSWQQRTEVTNNIAKIGEHVYCFGPEVVDCLLK